VDTIEHDKSRDEFHRGSASHSIETHGFLFCDENVVNDHQRKYANHKARGPLYFSGNRFVVPFIPLFPGTPHFRSDYVLIFKETIFHCLSSFRFDLPIDFRQPGIHLLAGVDHNAFAACCD
jgi:hypothetical protein